MSVIDEAPPDVHVGRALRRKEDPRLIETRSENMAVAHQGRDQIAYVKPADPRRPT